MWTLRKGFKMIGRREMLGAIAGAATGGQKAVRMVANQFMGIEGLVGGMGKSNGPANHSMSWAEASPAKTNSIEPTLGPSIPFWRRAAMVLKNKQAMDEYTSRLFEDQKFQVGPQSLDWDIASKKSFSMAAKIAYQRQRNVALITKHHTSPDRNDGMNVIWEWLQKAGQ